MVYDAARAQLVAAGGAGTWLRTGTTWSQPTWVTPSARGRAAAAYDPVRGKVVVFGGQTAASSSATPLPNTLNETWEWDGHRWTQVLATTPPSVRAGQWADYDSSRQTVIMFGGGTYDGVTRTWYADLYEYDGSAWTAAPLATGRVGVIDSAMAYDAHADQIVTFGGATAAKVNLQDTWTWDATAGWALKTLATKPGVRRNHVIGYDPIRQRTVLFGGANPGLLTDVWEWTGAAWTQIVASGPVGRKGGALVFNPDAERLNLCGNGLDLWEWSGTEWTQRPIDMTGFPDTPPYRAATAYDAARHDLVMFGGKGTYQASASTLIARYRPNVTTEACTFADLDYDGDGLAGCADPECWSVCTPLCPPGATSCPSSPSCGDGTCDPLEDCDLCPTDCGGCGSPLCGDFRCNGPETHATCPSDCY
jgi:hypothetical protein